METITAELMDNPERVRGKEGRKYYSAAAKEKLLEEYRSSGLTQREYAKRSGIKYSTFVSWIQGVRMGCGEGQGGAKSMEFEELRLGGASGLVEVQMPDGTKISGSSAIGDRQNRLHRQRRHLSYMADSSPLAHPPVYPQNNRSLTAVYP